MDWLHWLLLTAVMLLLSRHFLGQKKEEKKFDPHTYSYKPSSDVLDSIARGDEIEAIRLIRKTTGLDLKDGRDLCRHLKAADSLSGESIELANH